MFIQQSLFDHNQFGQVSEVEGSTTPARAFEVGDTPVDDSSRKREGRRWKLRWQTVLFVVNIFEDLNTILSSPALMIRLWGIPTTGWLAAWVVTVVMLIVVFVRNRKGLRENYERRTLVDLFYAADFDLVRVLILTFWILR